ncbi:hypothetical protein YPPY32_4835, partial [Yersinia pestis PY-32]
MRAIAS